MPTDHFFITPEKYQTLYEHSLRDPEEFWGELARQELEWFVPFTEVYEWPKPGYQWFGGGKINITHNCLDRHVAAGRGDKTAYIYTNERDEESRVTYSELLSRVNQAANALKSMGIGKGDRVIIYMPLTLEQIVTMLACARIGAVHSVVYAGFSAQALVTRIEDSEAKLVVTASSTIKNGKEHDLLRVVRQALESVERQLPCVVLQRSWDERSLQAGEKSFSEWVAVQSTQCEAEPMSSDEPLFILYTSGTTGTPKGVVHGHAGYGLYSHITMKWNFDVMEKERIEQLGDSGDSREAVSAKTSSLVHWTAADTGWITGHSYIVYGPLSVGVTSLMYEGGALAPAPDRYWELVEKYRVTSFYTAPTVIRLLMREGEAHPARHNLSSLRILGSVGEPINPAAWQWYFEQIGRKQVPVIDTWWQTETGGHMLVTPASMKQKPGSAGLPFFGVEPKLVDDAGNEITLPDTVGQLVVARPWPGALLTCWNNPDRFAQYWTTFFGKDFFYTGDVAQFDSEGYWTVLGRADDVINVAGIRIGTAEVESALVAHPAVTEAAVIGISDEMKGEVIHAYVTLMSGNMLTLELEKELKAWVKDQIGYIAVPESIKSVEKLPKTRSGKIMRRVLKATELGVAVGDTSTLEE